MTILAPLRGVTVRCFRETFAEALDRSGFDEAVTPFIAANPGVDPLRSSELRPSRTGLRITPQFIGKDPESLRRCLERVRAAGFETADLNCGCPYPMVRNKGRGSGLLRTPDILEKMIAVGCETMGEGRFSVKTRLGFDGNGELLKLMPIFNAHPLRFLCVHARNARQMYEGECDWNSYAAVAAAARIPVIPNGDLPLPASDSPSPAPHSASVMIGRAFVRALGARPDIDGLLSCYVEASREELCGERPVLGRMKELVAYWRDIPRWRRLWPAVKISRTLDEFRMACL